MTDKPSGMEMMLNSLLKAAGFDRATIEKSMMEIVNGIRGTLSTIAERLGVIDKRQELMDARLDRIERLLTMGKPNGAATDETELRQ